MNIISKTALSRGGILIDYAYSDKENPLSLGISDLIGIVAAYIAMGLPTAEIESALTERLGSGIAQAAQRTFQIFDDLEGRALWSQGAAAHDIMFSNEKLLRFYPAFR